MALSVAALVIAFGSAILGTSAANAGTYAVRACDSAPGAVNNSWSVVATAPADASQAVQSCPTQEPDPNGTVAQGLAVQDILLGPDAPSDGTYREWRFTAAPDTRIVNYLVTRDTGNRSQLIAGGFTPFGRLDGVDIPGETCYRPLGQPYCRIQGSLFPTGPVNAQTLAWGVRCIGNNFCGPGATLHDVWTAVRGAVITLEDTTPPSVDAASGPLTDTAWQGGTRSVTFGGADPTGIRVLSVYDSDSPIATKTAPPAASGGCGELNAGVAYTFTAPCAGSRGLNGAQVVDVDTRLVGNGTRSLRVGATDTAGNETRGAPITVHVDNEPAPAPAVSTDPAWSSAAEATWTWAVADEPDRAPIVAIEIERCGGGGAPCVDETLPGQPGGVQVEYVAEVAEGISELRVRHRDSAGNLGAFSPVAVVRRDRHPPTVTFGQHATPVDAGSKVEPILQVSDGLSGVRRIEREVRVDGGAWGPHTKPLEAPAGAVIRFRALADDNAGNASPWVESGDVRVRATPTPTPTPSTREAATLRGLRATVRGRRLEIRGSLRPAAATGRVAVLVRVRGRDGRLRSFRARPTIRDGRFVARLRIPAGLTARLVRRRAVLAYEGSSRHRPARATVTIRRSR